MTDIDTNIYKVYRFERGEWDSRGIYNRGECDSFDISASIQPISGNMLRLLPEHRRNSEAITIFSEERLFPSDEIEERAADVIIFDRKRFEIFKVKKWAECTDIPHYESIAIMEDRQGAKHDS